MKINLITLRMQHHARASGYDRLADFLDANIIVTPKHLTLTQRLFAKALGTLVKRSGSQWYHRQNLVAELKAAREWLRTSNQIFHFLYGENSYRYLNRLKILGPHNRVLCTYHTPTYRLQELVRDEGHLRRLDAAIVVSTAQIEFFSNLLGSERVFYVPHGIDTDSFSPPPSGVMHNEKVRCIFVGRHLRDFNTLAETAEEVGQRDRRIQFIIVAPSQKHEDFQGLSNVELYSGVSEDALLGLYRGADMLVLPLLDCTANNAVLEGMACGLPIISTDLPGVRDYVDESCALLTPKGQSAALADAIVTLKNAPAERQRMGQASRDRSLEFDWKHIAHRTQEIYCQLS